MDFSGLPERPRPFRSEEPRPDLPDAPTSTSPHGPAGAAASVSPRKADARSDLLLQQRLCCLLLEKGRNQKRWGKLARRFLREVASLRGCGARSTGSSRPRFMPGARRSPVCGASPATTASPKACTPKWSFCSARHMASETSSTIDCALGYCVLEIGQRLLCPITA